MGLLEQQPIVVITGISAAGKSTVAELLARRFPRGVHVRGDLFRRMVVAGRAEMTASPSAEAVRQLRLRYRLSTDTALAYHAAGFAVVVQDVVIGPLLAGYVDQIGARPLVVVVLAPDPTAVAAREAGRPKVAYRDGFDSIADLDGVLRLHTPRIGLWLDTSSLSAEQTVDEIVDRAPREGAIP